MTSIFLKALIAISIALIPNFIYSQFSIQVDQDLFDFVGRNQDRNYTMGLQFSYTLKPSVKSDFITKNLIHPYAGLLLFNKDENIEKRIIRTINLGSVNFTPDSLNTTEIITNDRPYSSLVYLSLKSQLLSDTETKSIETELKIGMMGLHLGNYLQTRIHVWNRHFSGKETPYDPLGWDNQVKDGGFFIAQYSINPKFFIGKYWGSRIRLDYRVDVGNYLNAVSTNALMIYGTPFSNILNFDSDMIGTTTGAPVNTGNKSLYAFVQLNPNLVLYNRAITGQPEIPISTEPMVLRINFGFALDWKINGKICTFAISQNFRSPEFNSQDDSNIRWHSWGAITFRTTPYSD